jgi:hypothetical protein
MKDFKKKFLIILDSCGSGTIAADAMQDVSGTHETWVLTAGREDVYTSAVVLATPREFVNSYNDEISYSIFSSMFTRKLMQLIAYTDLNPLLSEVPDLLNGQVECWRNGFKAECHTKHRSPVHLRDFFGSSCWPGALVVLGNEYVSFDEILPQSPPEGMWDDVGRGFETEPKNLLHRCVEVQVVDDVVYPGEPRFLNRGDEIENAIILSLEGPRGAEFPGGLPHVPIIAILLDIWSRHGTESQSLPMLGDGWEYSSGFYDWLMEKNGVTIHEEHLLKLFRPDFYGVNDNDFRAEILEARERLLGSSST